VWPGPRSTSVPSGVLIHPAVWPQQTWTETGGTVPLLGGAATPSNTSPVLRFISVPSGILIHPAIWPQQTWAKNWMGLCLFFWGKLGPHQTRKSPWADAYLHTKWHLSPSSRSATTDIGQKWGLCPFRGGELGPHLTQSRLSWGLPPYQVASWCIQPFSHNRNGQKNGGGALPPFLRRGARYPSSTIRPGPRSSSMPSFILIHLNVWPHCINVADTQDRQWSDSIGQTVLQTVAQKSQYPAGWINAKASTVLHLTYNNLDMHAFLCTMHTVCLGRVAQCIICTHLLVYKARYYSVLLFDGYNQVSILTHLVTVVLTN